MRDAPRLDVATLLIVGLPVGSVAGGVSMLGTALLMWGLGFPPGDLAVTLLAAGTVVGAYALGWLASDLLCHLTCRASDPGHDEAPHP